MEANRDFMAIKKGLQLIESILFPCLTTKHDLEWFVLVPASLYNKSLNNEAVTKQEFPKNQAEQNPEYQID